MDVSDGEQHSQEESSATTGKEPKTSKQGNSVHSGPNKNITDSVKDGPFSNQTVSNSNTKNGPKMKHTSKKAPRRKYYRPSNDTKTFQINNKGHLQCLQDPNLIHKPNDKGKLPGSREAPIYHEPGTVSCKTVQDLKKLYPNSFDRLGSLKGAYNIRIDPTVKPVTHARRKVPIESKEAIDKELDYLIEEEIITEQVEPTPWVSSVTFPRKPNGEVRVCLDPSNLNKAIIREHHKPMTVEEIAHELAGATVYTKANALKAFLQIHLTHKASLLTTFNSHRGRLRFLRMPFGAKMSQDVFQLRMDAILKQCPGVIGIHDDMVIFGVDQEDHDANLINLLNVCQKEGLVLNSKKLELQRERVTFFGAEYSAQGMHPDPKKVQGITEMTAPTDKQQLQSFLGSCQSAAEPTTACLSASSCKHATSPYPRRRPSDKGSTKQVQAENANALRKSSDSETDRLRDIQEEPRRRIGPSRVKELAKFFMPTSDEEENSRVNSRTRHKKLFEPKKEEESEK